MEWALLLVALALVVGLGSRRSARHDAAPTAGPTPTRAVPTGTPVLIPPQDQSEVEAMFAVVDHEAAAQLIRLLEVRLGEVIHRQVPVRLITPAPAERVARICFSNGMVVLATTRRPGDLIAMATAMLSTSVTLETFEVTDDGPLLRFGWRAGGALDVVAVGLDQAD